MKTYDINEENQSFIFNNNQNKLSLDKPIKLAFANLQSTKPHVYERFFDIKQPYHCDDNLILHFMDTAFLNL